MSVCVVVIKVVAHLLDDVARNLSSARSIEIGDRVTIVDALQSGEVFSNFTNWGDLGLGLTGSCGHLLHNNKRARRKSFRFSIVRARIEGGELTPATARYSPENI